MFAAFREEFAALDRETFCIITVDSKNRMIGFRTRPGDRRQARGSPGEPS